MDDQIPSNTQQGQGFDLSDVLSKVPRYSHAIEAAGASARQVPIALLLHRGLNLCAAEFSALHLKRFFLPIDPANPIDRIETILEDSSADVLVVDHTTRHLVKELSELSCANVVDLSETPTDGFDCTAPQNFNDLISLQPEDLAYLIYTSGSTGRPKGVPVHWSALENHNAWFIKQFELSPNDRCTQLMSEGFDVSIQDILPTLRSGASLYPPDKELLSDPFRFFEWIEENQLTVLSFPTALWHTLVPVLSKRRLPESVRLVLIGGEQVNPHLVEQWFSLVDASRVRLVNMYGPTEVTIASMFCELSPERSSAIGKPIDNIDAFLLDADGGVISKTEVVGELVLSGTGVARGYWNRPEETTSAFFQSEAPGKQCYRTGDLARYDDQGNFLFVGRKDNQVKLRGFRIELNEIALTVSSHPLIENAIVKKVEQGREFLACFAVPVAGVDSGDAEFEDDLRRHLLGSLPEYMIPSAFQFVSQFPLTVGGKVDTGELLKMLEQKESPDRTGADGSETVRRICRVWKEVLGQQPDSLNATFVDSGGDSLTAMTFVLRLQQEFDLAGVGLAALAIHNTVERLAVLVDELTSDGTSNSTSIEPAVTHFQPESDTMSEPVVVLFHPAGGGCYQYNELLNEELLKRHEIVIVESPFLNRDLPAGENPTVAQIAKEYYPAVVKRLTAGREVIVGGYSFGAVLAWEFAQLLKQDGHPVKRVINIDQPVPSEFRICGIFKRMGNWMARLKYPRTNLQEFKRVRKLNQARAASQAATQKGGDNPLSELSHLACLEDFYVGIENDYTPKPADLEMILIRGELFRSKFEFPEDYGWSAVTESLRTVRVPGSHATLFNERFIGELRNAFAEALN